MCACILTTLFLQLELLIIDFSQQRLSYSRFAGFLDAWQSVLDRERRGDYLGKTVQVSGAVFISYGLTQL